MEKSSGLTTLIKVGHKLVGRRLSDSYSSVESENETYKSSLVTEFSSIEDDFTVPLMIQYVRQFYGLFKGVN